MRCNRGLVLVQQASNSTIGPRGTEIVHRLFMGFGVRFFFVSFSDNPKLCSSLKSGVFGSGFWISLSD
jgi:hypothetical protein